MIRTRDYFLFLLTVLFLFVGISASVVRDIGPQGPQTAAVGTLLANPTTLPDEDVAVVVVSSELDHESLLAAMRNKIAARGEVSVAPAPEPDIVVVSGEESSDATAPTSAENVTEPLTCTRYAQLPVQPYPGAQFKEVEGARVMYRIVEALAAEADVNGFPVTNEEVLLQLPLRTMPFPTPSCIPHDVVGIALDGSQIRNNEASVYAIFGSETLVGYALDGFPIYGKITGATTDQCGGVVVAGMYRYYLHDNRDVVLNCFAGVPVTL